MDYKRYSIARINKDKMFDGRFYFGVKTTKIFCRPSCPSPIAKESNVEYFKNISEPLEKGYRPCLRCRPEIYYEREGYNVDASEIVKSGIEFISKGFLNDKTVNDLAKELNVDERHLRRLFNAEMGISPLRLAIYYRVSFSKKLLLDSDFSITDIAYVSGFGSIRQFNKVFKDYYGISPSKFRKDKGSRNHNGDTIMIPYDDDFDYEGIMDFLRSRIIVGVESIKEGIYSRTFRVNGSKGYFEVQDNKELKVLELRINSDKLTGHREIYYRVKRMFDIDCNRETIKSHLYNDMLFAGRDIPRLMIAFNSFEFMIRAILGQQISVKAATTLAFRVVEKAGIKHISEQNDLKYYFPNEQELMDTTLDSIGITKRRVSTIESAIDGLVEGVFSLENHQAYEEFCIQFMKIKGIGDWTANYVAMRGLGMVNAFPASDLGVIKALMVDGKKLSNKEIKERAESWSPYRAYGTLLLWLMD